MTKIAASKPTKEEKISAAKSAFIMSLFDISWRMATAFLVPVVAGVIIDGQRGDQKTFTIVGVIVGVLLAIMVIIKLAFDINKTGNK